VLWRVVPCRRGVGDGRMPPFKPWHGEGRRLGGPLLSDPPWSPIGCSEDDAGDGGAPGEAARRCLHPWGHHHPCTPPAGEGCAASHRHGRRGGGHQPGTRHGQGLAAWLLMSPCVPSPMGQEGRWGPDRTVSGSRTPPGDPGWGWEMVLDPCPLRGLPLQGWDQINVGSTMVGLALSGPFSLLGATAPGTGSPPWGGDGHGSLGQQGWS